LLDYLGLIHDIEVAHSNSSNFNLLIADSSNFLQSCTLAMLPSTPVIDFSSLPSLPASCPSLEFDLSFYCLDDMEVAVQVENHTTREFTWDFYRLSRRI